jgi:hypothetical protein
VKQLDNLSGQTFGIWEVLEFDHMKYLGTNHQHGMSYYKCRCKNCGRIFIVPRSNLLRRPTKPHNGLCADGRYRHGRQRPTD